MVNVQRVGVEGLELGESSDKGEGAVGAGILEDIGFGVFGVVSEENREEGGFVVEEGEGRGERIGLLLLIYWERG